MNAKNANEYEMNTEYPEWNLSLCYKESASSWA